MVTPPVGLKGVVVTVLPGAKNDEQVKDCDWQPDPQWQHQVISGDVEVVSVSALQLEAEHDLKRELHQDAADVPDIDMGRDTFQHLYFPVVKWIFYTTCHIFRTSETLIGVAS